MAFEQEVAAVEEVDLGPGRVGGERAGAVGAEDLVVGAPDRQQRDAAVTQVGVQYSRTGFQKASTNPAS